ncbi:MAG: hypothetical protein J6V00_07665 [Bacteroidaceae bacterium]|nr:hypothetical protein [Bacteroidaceae bacterium]
MKQTIIDLLKTKFEGVDESILSRIADTKAAKAVKTEDEAKTFVEGVTLNQLLSSYGDIRSTEAQRTAVTNYEKKHGLKDGKKVNVEDDPKTLGDEDDNKGGDDKMPAWAKAMMEENKKLAEQIANINTEKRTTSRKQKLDEVINRLPERDRKGYARTSYKELSDEAFDTLLEEITGEVDEFLKNEKTTGATFGAPFHRTSSNQPRKGEASKDEVDAVVKGMM